MAKLGLIFYAHTLVSMISLFFFKIMLKEYASHVMFREWIINGFDSYKGPLCVFIINGRYFEVGYSPDSHRVVFLLFPLIGQQARLAVRISSGRDT